MYNSDYFTFNGQSSGEFGISIIYLDSGLREYGFGVNRELNKLTHSYTGKSYANKYEKQPIRFKLTIAKEIKWTEEMRDEVVRWLWVDGYKPLIFNEYPDIVYYATVVGSPKLFISTVDTGYIELEFECNSYHGYTYPMSTQQLDLSENLVDEIELFNKSNLLEFYYPEIEITSIDGGTIKIINNSDMGREFKFDNLQPNETIYINNERKEIITTVLEIHRYNDFNKKWLRLAQGRNFITVDGKCILKTRMQFPILK